MLRSLTESDLPAAMSLLERVGLAGGAANISRYLRWQPDGVWGWFDEAGLVGTVTLLRFGDVAFVGCMAVEPARRERGFGRALLEHAHVHGTRSGVATFLLEATPIGARMYTTLGYVVESETVIVERSAIVATSSIAPLAAEFAAILELDRVATASQRRVMIGGLIDDCAGAVVRSDRELTGFGLVVANAAAPRLGPVIARDPGAGRALVDRLASSAPSPTSAAVSVANDPAVAALQANGFVEVRRLKRMRRGPALSSRGNWIWALASPGAG